MEYTRWYDKDSQLKLIMETLEHMDKDVQIAVAEDLLQMILQISQSDYDKIIAKLNENYIPIRRRWYDKDETTHSAIELIKIVDENLKHEVFTEIIYSILYFTQEKDGENPEEE